MGDWYTLGIAEAGVYGQGPNPYGSTPSSITTYDNRLENYFHRLMEGGTVIDKRPAFALNYDAAVSAVYRGPMLNPKLPEQTVNRLFEGNIPASQAGKPNSIDSVSLDVYLAYWRPLGVRVGKRQGDSIVWEDGTIEPITVGLVTQTD